MPNKLFLFLGVVTGSIGAMIIFCVMLGMTWWFIDFLVFSPPTT